MMACDASRAKRNGCRQYPDLMPGRMARSRPGAVVVPLTPFGYAGPSFHACPDLNPLSGHPALGQAVVKSPFSMVTENTPGVVAALIGSPAVSVSAGPGFDDCACAPECGAGCPCVTEIRPE